MEVELATVSLRRRARVLRLTLAVVCGHAVALATAAQAEVKWKSGPALALQRMAPNDAIVALGQLAARPDMRHVVVRFDAPVVDSQRAKLRESGVELLSYLGDNAYFATLDRGGLNAVRAAQVAPLTLAQAVNPEWKLHEQFIINQVPEWAVVDRIAPPEGRDAHGLPADEADKGDAIIGVYVVMQRDVALDGASANIIAAHGGVVRDKVRSVNAYVVEMPMSQVAALAGEDAIQWIEPALPRLSELNDSNRARTGANIVQDPPYGLDGAGVTVLVYDGGTGRSTHMDFGGRHSNHDSSALSDHSTHVAGTIGGSGAASGGVRRGMAPAVTLLGYGFQYDGSGTFLYDNPGDLEADYNQAINMFGADISNNSIGTNTAPNGFPCSLEGDYGVTDALIDAIVAGSLGRPFRIVWANGNERGSGRCGTTYHTTAPPAMAKNSICVGALNSNDDSITSFTSWGPTDDGRLKPDVSAPGCEAGNDGGVTSCGSGSDTAYSVKCGTSMASPTVCGLSALLLQDFRAHHPGEPDFRNSTLKILLAHTAVDLGNAGPDYQFGYGSVRIQAAVDFMRSGNFLESEVSQGGAYSGLVVVNPGDPALKVTLAWDDPSATPNVIPNLINDLDLVVTDPLGGRHFPWTLDPNNGALPAVQTQEDHRNNNEQVFVANPMAGVWRVEVRGTTVPQGPQSFSLAASPLLVNCSPAGICRLDGQRYQCSDTVTIRVVDCDLNTDDNVIETVSVNVASSSNPSGQAVLLTETGGPTAAFEGSISINTTGSGGALLVANGDTITATYIDANDGMGGLNVPVTGVGTVDCTPPVASAVMATNVQPRSATITFNTDEPARATVLYGTSCGSLSSMTAGSGLNSAHSINLTGLVDNTPYYFAIEVEDEAGNAATYNNGGSCFTFMTPEVPDFFTQLFAANDNDTDNRTLLFTPNGSVDFYAACGNPTTMLPVDPAGGTVLSLTDDSSTQVTLSGGAQVRLYGTSYSSFFVGSNGYITFGSGDSDYTESLADHFAKPRIAPLFDDLNPTQAGTISWRQLGDSAVVTWLNVTEHNGADSNTFQVQMFFDGRIRITWLRIDATDGLAGLSKGLGLDPDYFPSDISAYPSCGPMPPGAQSQSIGTPANTAIAVTLVAADDGLPAPPMLSYIIRSLPAHGTLTGPGATPINSVPYTIPLGGNTVTYRPGLNYIGPDQFMFQATDGGTPPGGGSSNVAPVSITVGVPALIYAYNFDTNPGWTTQDQWAFGHPTGGGTHNLDPTGGFTGANVYGFNLAGDYPNNMPATVYLTTTAINCSTITQTTLKFRRWLGVESSTYDHANIQVSNNGSAWTTVWAHSGAAISEAAWSLQSYDISAVADNQATVYIRWGMGTTDGSVTYPGWNIDDVQIFGVQPLITSSADLDGDGFVSSSDLAILLGSWGPCPGCAADLDGDGSVGASDLAILLGSWAPPV